ncbi:MAG: DNA-formamidopyrimidine glycosylase, partial [Bacilli bacterium]|nr:DNA-formamidopyrimidine glycosylase [Bacilli bacterium]
MPELPEVETIKNILAQFVIGKTIKDIKVFNTNTIEGDYLAFIEQLKGKTISELSRVGKFIIFHFNESIVLLSHLRMEGKYFYHDYALDTFEKHACVVFFFTDNTVLEYNDTRKFGLMQIVQSSVYLSVLPLSKLGPEPFDVKDIKSLHQKLSKKSIPIKAVLLDQTFLAGLGNIYVDEVLYLTKIHPETPANRISKAQLKNIIEASVQVLNVAIQSGGSTIRSYHPSQG